MDNLVDKYNMRDRFVSILVSGFIGEDEYGDVSMKAIYSYHLADSIELDEVFDFVNNTFEHEFEYDTPETFENFDDDVDDFLDSLGIDTE